MPRKGVDLMALQPLKFIHGLGVGTPVHDCGDCPIVKARRAQLGFGRVPRPLEVAEMGLKYAKANPAHSSNTVERNPIG